MPVGSGSFAPLMEHPNRGKRSIGLALERPEALDVLHELIRTSDVFLTNFLPAARRRLGIEVDDVRKINPDIIYVRGSGFGSSGPDSEKGGYDSTAFWARGGSALGTTPTQFDGLCKMPAGAYGDSLGGHDHRRRHRRGAAWRANGQVKPRWSTSPCSAWERGRTPCRSGSRC